MRHRDLTLAGGAGLPDEAAAAPPPALAEGDKIELVQFVGGG